MRRNRTIAIAVLVLATVAMLPGCGVIMTPQYSTMLDEAAAISSRMATLAENGQLTEQKKTETIRELAQTFRSFQDARDGKSTSSAAEKK